MTIKKVKTYIAYDTKTETDVIIDDADVGYGFYECYECKKRLIAKKGKILAHHFSHVSKSYGNEIGCSGGESWQHQFCKNYIQKRSENVCIEEKCYKCNLINKINCFEYIVKIEYDYNSHGQKYRLDVALLNKNTNKIAICIEIHHTHASEQDKIQNIQSDGILFFEIKTSEFIDKYESNKEQITIGYIIKKCKLCIQKEDEIKRKRKLLEQEILEEKRMQIERIEKESIEKERILRQENFDQNRIEESKIISKYLKIKVKFFLVQKIIS